MPDGAKIQVMCTAAARLAEAGHCATALGVSVNRQVSEALYQLNFEAQETNLTPLDHRAHGAIRVDFVSGKNDHRRRFGGGKSQLIAKACGVRDRARPSIIDATAGLGQDAFALACLGCRLTLLERSPVAHALLADGLRRARESTLSDAAVSDIVEHMQLILADGTTFLGRAETPAADIVYLDPMFPEKAKSAAVNKNMQALQALLGADEDEDRLLEAALAKAHLRVVVKRPRLAPTIGSSTPTFQLQGKATRFDIYVLRALPRD